jgi:hypothetical protein
LHCPLARFHFASGNFPLPESSLRALQHWLYAHKVPVVTANPDAVDRASHRAMAQADAVRVGAMRDTMTVA